MTTYHVTPLDTLVYPVSTVTVLSPPLFGVIAASVFMGINAILVGVFVRNAFGKGESAFDKVIVATISVFLPIAWVWQLRQLQCA